MFRISILVLVQKDNGKSEKMLRPDEIFGGRIILCNALRPFMPLAQANDVN